MNAESWLSVRKESVSKLKKVQLGFLKRLLQLPRSTPTAGRRGVVGHRLVLVRRLKFQFELLAKKISEASIFSNFTSHKS